MSQPNRTTPTSNTSTSSNNEASNNTGEGLLRSRRRRQQQAMAAEDEFNSGGAAAAAATFVSEDDHGPETELPFPQKQQQLPILSTATVASTGFPGAGIAAAFGNSHYSYESPILSPFYRHLISPFCEWLVIRCSYPWITPNSITLTGLAFACTGAFLLELDCFLFAALFWILYAICDNLDGKQARIFGMASAMGEYLDHIVDSFVCSLLTLFFLKTLIPHCYSVSSFSLKNYLLVHSIDPSLRPTHPVPLDQIHTYWTPFLVLLLVAQVPFYFGLWAYNVTGQLLVGMKMKGRSWFTVDEVNFLLVPLLCALRHWKSSWILQPLFTLGSSMRFFLFGHDCSVGVPDSDPSIITFTIGSLFSLIMVLFTVGSGIPVFTHLYGKSASHFPLTIGAYVATVLFLPLPPIVLMPFFSWMCSCLIFRRMAAKYSSAAELAESQSRGTATTLKLPVTPIVLYRKSLPLCALLVSACILHLTSVWGGEELVATVTLLISVFSAVACATIVAKTCDWLQKASLVIESMATERPLTVRQLTETIHDDETRTFAQR